MNKFNVTKLIKLLEEKTKEELIKEISTLCKTSPQVKEYYQTQESDAKSVLEKYKDIIEKEFVHGKTRGLPKAQLSVVRKAVQDFKKVTKNPELLAELMFTFVESISGFNSEFGVEDETYYTSSESMFKDVLKLLKKNDLLAKFEDRAYQIVENATEGWGHSESLTDFYEEVYGEFTE